MDGKLPKGILIMKVRLTRYSSFERSVSNLRGRLILSGVAAALAVGLGSSFLGAAGFAWSSLMARS